MDLVDLIKDMAKKVDFIFFGLIIIVVLHFSVLIYNLILIIAEAAD